MDSLALLRRLTPAHRLMSASDSLPLCPHCRSPMVLRTQRRGERAGEQYWGCSRYPTCRATRQLVQARPARRRPTGRTAQAVFDEQRQRQRAQQRRRFAVASGLAAAGALVIFLALSALADARWGAVGALAWSLVVIASLVVMQRSVFPTRRRADGGRRTDRYLAALADVGYIVLHDRRLPGGRDRLDHLVVGPTGVYVVEKKPWRGQLAVEDDRLFVDGRHRDHAADQVLRAATATQDALIAELKPLGVTVTPILWFHQTDLPLLKRTVRGAAVTGGRGLSRAIRTGPTVLTPEQVMAIAVAADEILPPASEHA